MPACLRVLLLLVFGVVSVGCSLAQAAERDSVAQFLDGFYHYEVLNQPLDVSGITLSRPKDAAPLALSSRQGKWLVLNLWATWCPPCVEELPKLDRLKYLKAGRDFDVLAVALDRRLNADRIAYYLERWQIKNLPPLHDTDKTLDPLLDISRLPVTYLVNPKGQAVLVMYGPANWSSRRALAFVDAIRADEGLIARYGNKNAQAQTP